MCLCVRRWVGVAGEVCWQNWNCHFTLGNSFLWIYQCLSLFSTPSPGAPPPAPRLLLYSCCDVGQSQRGEQLKIRWDATSVWMSTHVSSCIFSPLWFFFLHPLLRQHLSGSLRRVCCCYCGVIRCSEAEQIKTKTARMPLEDGHFGCLPGYDLGSISWLWIQKLELTPQLHLTTLKWTDSN